GVIDHAEIGGAAAGESDVGGFDAGRQVRRGALLEEGSFLDAVDEALEHHRAVADADKRAIGDGDEVVHKVQLGVPGLGEVHLAGIGDGDFAASDFEDDGLFGHAEKYTGPLRWRSRGV